MRPARWRARRVAWGCAMLALVLGAASPAVWAGEKLNIFGAKTRIQPGSEKEARHKRSPGLEGLANLAPYPGTSPSAPGRRLRPRNLKMERELRVAQDEKENWALLEPGQLRKGEDKELTDRSGDYGVEDPGQSPGPSRGYLFHGLEPGKPAPEGDPGSGGNQRQGAGQAQQLAQENSRPFRLNPFGSDSGQGSQPAMGAHMATELNFRSLLNPEQTTASLAFESRGDGSGADLSLKDLMGNAGLRMPSAQPGRSLTAFPSGGPGLGAPVNQAPDLTRQPVNPVTAPSADFSRSGLRASPFPASPGSLGDPGSRGGLRQPSISGFSTLPSPALQPSRPTLRDDFSGGGGISAPRRKF